MQTLNDANHGVLLRAQAPSALLLAIGATAVPAAIALGLSIGKAKRANDLAALALSSYGDAGVLSGSAELPSAA